MDFSKMMGNILGKNLEELNQYLKEELRHIVTNNILEYQSEEYKRCYFVKTLLFRNTPMKLLEIYQPLFLRNNIEYKRISTEDVEDLFKKNNRISIIGSAGCGKSTLTKYLYLKSVDQNFRIPIKVELRYLNNSGLSISQYITEKIFKLNDIEQSDRIIKRLLNSGRFIFFLDGFDEIDPELISNSLKQIDDLTRVYNKNCYLITSRNYLSIEELPLFDNYYVCKLEEDDIEQFIIKQLKTFDKIFTEKILSAIKENRNKPYQSFLENPLLLTMFILTYQINAETPSLKSLFYSKVIDALSYEHDSFSKLSYVRKKHSKLSVSEIHDVLEIFSFITYFNGEFSFQKNRIVEIFELIKIEFDLIFSNHKLLDDLLVSICILTKNGHSYLFAHRSLQEYFTAKYITGLGKSNKIDAYKLLEERLPLKVSKRLRIR